MAARTTTPKMRSPQTPRTPDTDPTLELDDDGRRLVVLSFVIQPQMAWNDGRGEVDSITNVDIPQVAPMVFKASDVGPVVMARLRENLPSLEAQARAAVLKD